MSEESKEQKLEFQTKKKLFTLIGGYHELRWQDFEDFWHPLPSSLTSLLRWHLANPPSPLLVNVVYGCPLAENVVCSFCKVVPRKSPIYHSKKGAVVCTDCKHSTNEKFHRNEITMALEKMLFALPTSCRFQKNGCKIIKNQDSMTFHEEDCEYRRVFF